VVDGFKVIFETGADFKVAGHFCFFPNQLRQAGFSVCQMFLSLQK
jgi:hypothetical protein